MNYGQQENNRVKEQIVKGLFEELKDTPFSKIRIASLIETAGVARASYYRNFDSKEAILEYYLSQLIAVKQDRALADRQLPAKETLRSDLTFAFRIFLTQRERFLLLFDSGLSAYVFEYLQKMPRIDPEKEARRFHDAYDRAFFTGAMSSVLQQWLLTGAHESPAEMAAIMLDKLPAYLYQA
ncbi:TetR/AcrR family transcriptional regulator [Leuconostocaceae bacterium ESL0958]|nr:TetR/AcrR family transcriptional regulator [Leuconostocaceae bacterium ESL0958]